MEDSSFLPDYCRKKTLILGCGNRLFGDDGFGPAVIEHLIANHAIPEDVYVMDVGTGVRKILFTLTLAPGRPTAVVLIDAIDRGKKPGELFEVPVEDLPPEKQDDFSLHQVPSSNLAMELRKAGVDIHVLACQIHHIPRNVSVGLSDPVRKAVPHLCSRIVTEFFTPASR